MANMCYEESSKTHNPFMKLLQIRWVELLREMAANSQANYGESAYVTETLDKADELEKDNDRFLIKFSACTSNLETLKSFAKLFAE